MTNPPKISDVAVPAIEEVGVQIDLLDTFSREFVEGVLAHDITGAPSPRRPLGMHPRIASALRDIARDELAAARLYGPLPARGSAR